jgi:hypothetical protein
MEADTWLVKHSWFDIPTDPRSRPKPECPTIQELGRDETDEPELYVGHTQLDLRRENTLKRVYLDRIWEILERFNNASDGDRERVQKKQADVGQQDEGRGNGRGVVGKKGWDWNGIYTDRGAKDQTLLLYIDMVSLRLDGRRHVEYPLKDLTRLLHPVEIQQTDRRDHVPLPHQSSPTFPSKRLPDDIYAEFIP